jgi:hypothetical protein
VQRVCGRSAEKVELQREHSRFLIGGIVVTLADGLDAQQDLRKANYLNINVGGV